ncbi:MAG: SCP2 sterol-binding domain-containing protein [Polyangiaceae bacterium]|nr:SCP2 sterol-binding domain-containing protein [Polyangiaceae bacterium]
MYAFPTQDWANAYKDALNQSATYKEAAKDWTHGSVSMIVKANPSIGIATDIGLILDVDQGNCRAATVVSAEEAQAAPFVIVAEYSQWKSVMKGELDPIKGMMQGKLKLTKGHMPTIVKYVHSNRALVSTIANVATKFPDE